MDNRVRPDSKRGGMVLPFVWWAVPVAFLSCQFGGGGGLAILYPPDVFLAYKRASHLSTHANAIFTDGGQANGRWLIPFGGYTWPQSMAGPAAIYLLPRFPC